MKDRLISCPPRCLVLLAWALIAATPSSPAAQEGAGDNRTASGGPVAALVGDGRADDAAALQSLVDASTGNLSLPAGTYRLSEPVVIELDRVRRTSIQGHGAARVVMDGPGPAFRFVGTHDGTAAPATFDKQVWQRQSSPMVDGIEIVGSHPQAVGIEADGTMQLTLSRVVVRETLHGIHLTGRNRNVSVSDCHIYDCTGVGLFLHKLNLHQINVVGCHISYNDRGGIVLKDSEIRNLQIGSCDIEGNMGGPDAAPSANVELDAAGTSIGEVAIVGCTIQHAHDTKNSANIRIDCGSAARSFTDEVRHGNITIADNILSDVQVNIELKNARGVTITGNTIWKGYTQNLLVENCRNVVLSGNVFDRNPRYGYGDGSDAALGARFVDCADCTLVGNHFYGRVDGEAALILRRCQRFNITGCTLLDYGRCGILFDQVAHTLVTSCLIRDDQTKEATVSIAQRGDNLVQISQCQLSHAP